MEKTFSLGQSNELIKDGRIYDLHNLYCFSGFLFEVEGRRLQIRFDPISGEGNNASSILLSFSGLTYLELSPSFGVKKIDGLDEMGYKSPGDKDDEWLLREEQACKDDHLFFRLDEGDFIRVHCQRADLKEVTKPSLLSM